MQDFLLEYSGVAKSLELPLKLSEIIRSYCETPEKLEYIVSLLERLPRFVNDE